MKQTSTRKEFNVTTQSTRNRGCTHTGMTHVFSIGEAKIWAGSESQSVTMWGKTCLWISLLGHPPSGVRKRREPSKLNRMTNKALANVAAYFKKQDIFLPLDWPDMSAPDYPLEFWKALVSDIKTLKGDVVIHCMGGHGRTGTALAILAFLTGACGSDDPVVWVREHYCQEAVETAKQINYLQDEIGIPTQDNVSDRFMGSYSDRSTSTAGDLNSYLVKHRHARETETEGHLRNGDY